MNATSVATYTITTTDAEALLDWVGNNGIDSDVTLYDGGQDDMTGETFFGFSADVRPSAAEIATALVRAAQIVRNPNSGTFVTFLATTPDAAAQIAPYVGTNETRTDVQVVIWNTAMVEG